LNSSLTFKTKNFKFLSLQQISFQEIFEISHNGDHCVAESVCRYQTGDFAVMNLCATAFDPSTQKTILAAGHNEKCQTYELKLALESVVGENDQDLKTNNNPGLSIL
jgi:hypothetical protein